MPRHLEIASLLLTLDLAGTAVFAISGAAVGVKHRLDIFGVCVLAFVAGNAGGMLRDVLIGAAPPDALSGWQHVTISLLAGVVTFFWHPRLERLHTPVLIFDAAGLALFSVSGTQKALAFGLSPLIAPLLGMLTGIGGGMLRDVLVGEIPTVLRKDLYALAALAGAGVVVAGQLVHVAPAMATIGGAALCFGVRLVAIRRGWGLPTADRISSQPGP
ncbi:MAG TPA: trimeric intracellular cation channel family protein [Vicinamibacterales bacterium]|jgi:uncharacterized membrane protein YeiH